MINGYEHIINIIKRRKNMYTFISIILLYLIAKIALYRYCITIFNDYENEKKVK